MTLPIIDSMLHGELRPNILPMLKTEKEISLIWRDLHKVINQKDCEFRTLEGFLTDALDKLGLVSLSEIYTNDREMRQMAQQARNKGMMIGNPVYTYINTVCNLSGLFPARNHSTPTDRFYKDLLTLESMRTKQALVYLAISVKDDAFMRTELRKLFYKIANLCKNTHNNEIREALTVLYFEILHTFNPVLQRGAVVNYETDFENFVYEWKGEFPKDDVVARYHEMVVTVIPVDNNLDDSISSKQELLKEDEPVIITPKNKFDRFLDAANTFSFSKMPKIKELGTQNKVQQLIECILEKKDTIADTFGHAAAMLEFLGFRQWIAEKYVSGYTMNQYDIWCTQNIMNKSKGNAFRHYRLSVNVTPSDTQNASYKYQGWKYKETVEEEYKQILIS